LNVKSAGVPASVLLCIAHLGVTHSDLRTSRLWWVKNVLSYWWSWYKIHPA